MVMNVKDVVSYRGEFLAKMLMVMNVKDVVSYRGEFLAKMSELDAKSFLQFCHNRHSLDERNHR